MDQRSGFDHIGIKAPQTLNLVLAFGIQEPLCYPPPDLGNFEGVRQAVVKDDAFGRRNDLGYVAETPPSGGVQYAVPVSLERVPVV